MPEDIQQAKSRVLKFQSALANAGIATSVIDMLHFILMQGIDLLAEIRATQERSA